MSGTTLALELADRYELGPEIGRGGMGVVHRGHDSRVGRDVAIKIMRADLADDSNVRRRFCAEAIAAARLQNPHAVLVFDAGSLETQPFVVMELLSGRTVADELRGGPLDAERVRRYALETLDALADAHEHGIVHRDIKPGNLLLTHDDHVKVADFGIAKIAEHADATLTGEIIGTAAYLAPERVAGESGTPASDIYSLGVVMYEALTGRRPFTGATPLALAQAIHSGNAPDIRTLCPDVDPSLARVVERALRRRPESRFASAAAMADALRHEDEDETELVTAPFTPVAETTRAMPPVATRRRVPAALFALLAIGAAIALGIFGATRLDGEEAAPPAEPTVASSVPAVTLAAPVAEALETTTQPPLPTTAAAPAAGAGDEGPDRDEKGDKKPKPKP